MHDQATGMRTMARAYSDASRPARPYLLTITSGKGGVGKSTMALNIGLTLARLGKKVLLVDADGNLAGLDVMAGVSPRFRLGDVFRGEQDVESVLVTLAPGLQLLPGSSGDPSYPQPSVEEQQAMLAEVLDREERVDVVIVDTAAGLTPDIIAYGEEADSVLVVTTPEPTAVMDAYAMVKILGLNAPGQLVELVINNTRSIRDGEETYTKLRAAIRHFLGREVACAGIVPTDPQASEAIRNQQPLVSISPRSAASLSIQSLSHTLLHEHIHASVRRTVAL
jgi:flagellar biosynthesis protein FlhG